MSTFDGGTTTVRLLEFLRNDLVLVLRPGQVVVLDNLQAHKNRHVDDLIAAASCKVLRLPPYSPDFNPIENAIKKVKTHLRKLGRRTVPELFAAIPEALARITGGDSLGIMAHCGYAATK